MTNTRASAAAAPELAVVHSPPAEQGKYLIILYDGECGLCDGLVKFVVARDRADRFGFLSLQSELAATSLTRYQVDLHDTDTMFVESSGGLLARSDAAIAILRELSGWWRFVAVAVRVVPKFVRDWGYSLIARTRYRMFGQHELCMMPSDKDRHKFLDIH